MKLVYAGREFELEGVSAADHVVRRILETGTFYEIDLLHYLTQMGLPRGDVIDVGAQIGNHSVFFGNFLAERVVSVEPNPAVIPILERNTKNNPGSYTIIRAGLGECAGSASVHVPDSHNCGTAQLVPGHDVNVTTLDAIATDSVVLVKVDVEGMELDVLRGGLRLLRTQHPDIVLEAATSEDMKLHRAFLSPLGYVPLSRWAATPTWHYAWRPSLRKRARALYLRLAFKLHRAAKRYIRVGPHAL